MELGKFLREVVMVSRVYVQSRGLEISNYAEHDWPWNEYKRHAELTSMVDFKCGFNEKGICKSHRRYLLEGLLNGREDISMCCCANCRKTIGHMVRLPNHRELLIDIAGMFDEKTGFWRKSKGCILPRGYRSTLCLFYKCGVEFGRKHPFRILISMMRTWWVKTGFDVTAPKFTADTHSAVRYRWVPYEKLRTMFEKQAKEKKKRKSNGNN